MQVAIVCLLIAGLLPYLTIAVAKAQPDFDNHTPRDWESLLQGFRRRAHAAHLNHFEQFPFFAAAVISFRSKRVLRTPAPCTPRTSMISGAVMGCL